MADSLAARRSVREHLETHFEEFLTSVSTYLRQAYPELQLSNEMSEEIAATVIVRVSHANPEPTDIEKALTDSADDVVRARRPRLSQARLLDEVNGPLRSELPRALPSLRLVQTLSRAPVGGGETETAADVVHSQGRLVLANPPVDLGASLGLAGAPPSETERPFDDEDTDERTQPIVSSSPAASAASASRQSPEEPAASDDDSEHAGLESGTLHEVTEAADSRVEPRQAAPADGTLEFEGERATGVDEGDGSAQQHNPFAAFEAAIDERTVPSAPSSAVAAEASPAEQELLPVVDVVVSVSDPLPSGVADGPAVIMQQRVSSVPPTQESIIPKPPSATVLQSQLEALQGQGKPPRTRRKASKRAKKAPPKAAKPRTTTKRKKPVAKKPPVTRAAPPATARVHASSGSAEYVSDDLAVLAMMGFPANPARAARLCVTAIAEELGLEETDLRSFSALVTQALERLRASWADAVPAEAPVLWQRTARQATLRAFLSASDRGERLP